METQEITSNTELAGSPKAPWPLRDIVFGISILIFLIGFAYAVARLDFIRYRPWLLSPLLLTLMILTEGILLFYGLYISKKRGFPPLFPSMSASRVFAEFFRALLFFLCIGLVIGLIAILLEFIFKTKISSGWESATLMPNDVFIIAVFIIGFTLGPISEEIFFRGFLYNAFKKRLKIWMAAIFQAGAFAVVHRYGWLLSFLVFVIGIALVIVYEKRKNLLSPIFVHITINAIIFIPLLVLALQNFHLPSESWEEAKVRPNWMKSLPPEEVERQENGLKQWEYAIDKWGSKGSKQWKKEANAFNAVFFWFPDDRVACAKARLGIVEIYLRYLGDYRRAIVEANHLLKQYPDQKEQCASVLSKKGLAFFMLKDFENNRIFFNKVISDFKEFNEPYETAQKGIKYLDVLEKRKK